MQTRRHSLVSTTLGTSRELVSFHFGDAKRDGEKVYIQASLHADETPAMLTAWTLKKRLAALDAEGRVRGEIVLVPVAIRSVCRSMCSGNFSGASRRTAATTSTAAFRCRPPRR